MASHTVNIKLQSGGADKVVGDFGKVRKASTDLIVNVKKIGNVFGEFGGSVGDLLQNFLKGSVWGIAQIAVQKLFGAIKDVYNSLIEKSETATKSMTNLCPAWPRA